jgi:hypothetical protein
MSRFVATALLTASLLCRPGYGAEQSPGAEAGFALGAAALNLVYLPAKALVAFTGGVAGAFAGLMTGGDVRAAYSIWVPTASGTYFVRPAHLEGTETLEFFGSDYADTPSTVRGTEGYSSYEAMYESK